MVVDEPGDSDARYDSIFEIERLVKEFESCTLAAQEFSHQAHLAVAAWYLAHHEKDEAIRFIRRGLQNFLAAKGIVTTDTDGYHETLTVFYMTILKRHLDNAERELSVVELINKLIRECEDKNLPLRHYTQERLMSPEARRRWLEPDLKPLERN